LLETRVLGVLVEKEATTPDSYPLTLNALISGCNQKSARDPVISATESEVQMALDSLRHHTLVIESTGGRVARYEHNVGRVLKLSQPFLALLAVLMLRGPQTPGELRINGERIYRFADISALEVHIEELETRAAGALVQKLPKQPGSREHRYAHLLSGAVDVEALASASATTDDQLTVSELAALKANLSELRGEVSELRGLVNKLYKELGVEK
jgi:uncharacterized protein YceH (UPF0502 family)